MPRRWRQEQIKFAVLRDTKGKKAEKKEASGHKTDAMLDLYDHEVAVVEPARAQGQERICVELMEIALST